MAKGITRAQIDDYTCSNTFTKYKPVSMKGTLTKLHIYLFPYYVFNILAPVITKPKTKSGNMLYGIDILQ